MSTLTWMSYKAVQNQVPQCSLVLPPWLHTFNFRLLFCGRSSAILPVLAHTLPLFLECLFPHIWFACSLNHQDPFHVTSSENPSHPANPCLGSLILIMVPIPVPLRAWGSWRGEVGPVPEIFVKHLSISLTAVGPWVSILDQHPDQKNAELRLACLIPGISAATWVWTPHRWTMQWEDLWWPTLPTKCPFRSFNDFFL